MGDAGMVDEIVAKGPSPINELFRLYEQKRHQDNPNLRWFRLPDEMMAAQIIDPSVFGGVDPMYVDVVVEQSGQYGSTHVVGSRVGDIAAPGRHAARGTEQPVAGREGRSGAAGHRQEAVPGTVRRPADETDTKDVMRQLSAMSSAVLLRAES